MLPFRLNSNIAGSSAKRVNSLIDSVPASHVAKLARQHHLINLRERPLDQRATRDEPFSIVCAFLERAIAWPMALFFFFFLATATSR